MLKKSLAASHNNLSSSLEQIKVLEHDAQFPLFSERLSDIGLFPLKPTGIKIFKSTSVKCATRCAHIAMWMQGPTAKK